MAEIREPEGLSEDIQSDFRAAMGTVATPVSVVTTMVEGEPRGTTVSAFASLSMSPAMLVVALDQGSNLLAAVRTTRRFGLNVLSVHQKLEAVAFAGKGGMDKFSGVKWALHDGLPRLTESSAWVHCELIDLVAAGDHFLLIGAVGAASASDHPPLTYYRRRFGTHAAID